MIPLIPALAVGGVAFLALRGKSDAPAASSAPADAQTASAAPVESKATIQEQEAVAVAASSGDDYVDTAAVASDPDLVGAAADPDVPTRVTVSKTARRRDHKKPPVAIPVNPRRQVREVIGTSRGSTSTSADLTRRFRMMAAKTGIPF